MVHEPEAAQDQLWNVDRRRYAIDDVIGRLIKGGPHSEHEYLTTKLDLAHMVGRDIAERAVIAAVEAPHPPRVEADRTWDQLSHVLQDSGWHRSSRESSVRLVADRHEEANRSEPARHARRSRSRLAPVAFSAGASPQPMVANSLYPPSRPPAAYR